ncbi:hypothetical protein MUP79_01390, partial [Candidatus Bathyarchaeota archaeon]|nr:hypothetical protein [Candidatus Bathyarchaeota archaeon]
MNTHAESVSSCEMMAIDLNARYLGVSDIQLMENAGAAVANEIARRFKKGAKICILAGTGGNGGDGMVAARHLASQGFKIDFVLLGDPETIRRKDVQGNWQALEFMDESVQLNVVK